MRTDYTGTSALDYYYHKDRLGSTVTITGSSADIVEKYFYDAFGNVIIKDANNNVLSQSAINNRYLFTGREYDSETGLYYYRARMYSSALGRFLQPDPIGYYDSMNLYQYCHNNPLNYKDPMGLCEKPIDEKLKYMLDVLKEWAINAIKIIFNKFSKNPFPFSTPAAGGLATQVVDQFMKNNKKAQDLELPGGWQPHPDLPTEWPKGGKP